MISVRLVCAKDAETLCPKLREADLREIEAADGNNPLVVLRQSIAWSNPCYTAVDIINNTPVAIFGASPDPVKSGLGRVWLLGSAELALHSITFLRLSREWIENLHDYYPVLWNVIDARNAVHLRWLRWCGFTILRKIDHHGPEQRPFYEFEKCKITHPAQPATLNT